LREILIINVQNRVVQRDHILINEELIQQFCYEHQQLHRMVGVALGLHLVPLEFPNLPLLEKEVQLSIMDIKLIINF